MTRTILTDAQWASLRPLLPAESGRRGRPYSQSHRTTVEAILWIARTGAPWRDLPARYGRWGTIYQRFRRWTLQGVFARLLDSLNSVLDWRVVMVDGTFVKVHQHGIGAPKKLGPPTIRLLAGPVGG